MESGDYGETMFDDVHQVRKRIVRRKKRKAASIVPNEENNNENDEKDKRKRNTLAARKYRQRRIQEIEVLDNRVKELEQKLNTANLETKWWKMEAERWKELAKKS